MNGVEFTRKIKTLGNEIMNLVLERQPLTESIAQFNEEIKKIEANVKTLAAASLMSKADISRINTLIKGKKSEVKEMTKRRDDANRTITAKQAEIDRICLSYRNLLLLLSGRDVKTPADYVLAMFPDAETRLSRNEIIEDITDIEPLMPESSISLALASLVKSGFIKRLRSNSEKFCIVMEKEIPTIADPAIVHTELEKFFAAPRSFSDFATDLYNKGILVTDADTRHVRGIFLSRTSTYCKSGILKEAGVSETGNLYQIN